MVSHEELGQSLIIDVSGIQDRQVLMLGIEETLHGLLGIVKLLGHVLLVVISLNYWNICKLWSILCWWYLCTLPFDDVIESSCPCLCLCLMDLFLCLMDLCLCLMDLCLCLMDLYQSISIIKYKMMSHKWISKHMNYPVCLHTLLYLVCLIVNWSHI